MFDCAPPVELNTPVVFECLTSKRYREPAVWEIPLQSIAERHLLTMEPEELDADWKLNEFFENIVVINLPRSKERWASITAELHAIGTQSFNRFKAIDGRTELAPFIWQKFFSNREGYDLTTEEGQAALDELHKGEAGCYMSHYLILKETAEEFEKAKVLQKLAKNSRNPELIRAAETQLRHYSRVLIFEDDSAFGFLKNDQILKEGAGTVLRKAISELPRDWDMLYFVSHASDPAKEIGTHLRQLRRSWNAAAYAVNHTMYKPLLKHLETIESSYNYKVHPVDNAISSIHQFHKVYAIFPSIVVQMNGLSEIALAVRDDKYQPQPDTDN